MLASSRGREKQKSDAVPAVTCGRGGTIGIVAAASSSSDRSLAPSSALHCAPRATRLLATTGRRIVDKSAHAFRLRACADAARPTGLVRTRFVLVFQLLNAQGAQVLRSWQHYGSRGRMRPRVVFAKSPKRATQNSRRRSEAAACAGAATRSWFPCGADSAVCREGIAAGTLAGWCSCCLPPDRVGLPEGGERRTCPTWPSNLKAGEGLAAGLETRYFRLLLPGHR
jgi:hypothetical protein